MVVTMVYYGLSLNATNLAGNPYTNFILVSLVEIPGKTKEFFKAMFSKFGHNDTLSQK
jgi:hypothetical protein